MDKRQEFIRKYISQVRESLTAVKSEAELCTVASVLVKARDARKTIFLMGNGGSAATASHAAEDLSKATIAEGFPRFKVIALTDNMPGILAWANDTSYDRIFVEQLKNLMEPGDVVIGISGSGNSANVLRAIEYANSRGITIGFSGYDGGKLAATCQHSIHVPNSSMPQVEDVHLVLFHLLISMICEEQK